MAVAARQQEQRHATEAQHDTAPGALAQRRAGTADTAEDDDEKRRTGVQQRLLVAGDMACCDDVEHGAQHDRHDGHEENVPPFPPRFRQGIAQPAGDAKQDAAGQGAANGHGQHGGYFGHHHFGGYETGTPNEVDRRESGHQP